MKQKTDPRHLKRAQVMQELFSFEFNQKNPLSDSANKIVAKISEIDNLIRQSAPERPLEQINKIDLAILRLSIFELIIKREVPPKVIVDEAVELGKEYGSDSSGAFINGALGRLIETEGIKT